MAKRLCELCERLVTGRECPACGADTQAVPGFAVGDRVVVLRGSRLPAVEEVMGAGVIERVTGTGAVRLFWVSGFPMGREAKLLRHEEVR